MRPDVATLSSELLQGKYRALAQAISLVERDDPSASQLLAETYAATGRAKIIGVTHATMDVWNREAADPDINDGLCADC